MKPPDLTFCVLTIFMATGFYGLLNWIGPEPSSQLTLLLVLISAMIVKLLIHCGQRLQATLRLRQTPAPRATLIIEKEEEMTHES